MLQEQPGTTITTRNQREKLPMDQQFHLEVHRSYVRLVASVIPNSSFYYMPISCGLVQAIRDNGGLFPPQSNRAVLFVRNNDGRYEWLAASLQEAERIGLEESSFSFSQLRPDHTYDFLSIYNIEQIADKNAQLLRPNLRGRPRKSLKGGKQVCVYLDVDLAEKFKRLGGSEWLARQLRSTVE